MKNPENYFPGLFHVVMYALRQTTAGSYWIVLTAFASLDF